MMTLLLTKHILYFDNDLDFNLINLWPSPYKVYEYNIISVYSSIFKSLIESINIIIGPPTSDTTKYSINIILLLSLFVLPPLINTNDLLTPLLQVSIVDNATEPNFCSDFNICRNTNTISKVINLTPSTNETYPYVVLLQPETKLNTFLLSPVEESVVKLGFFCYLMMLILILNSSILHHYITKHLHVLSTIS